MGPLRLCTPQMLGGNLDVSQGVFLDAELTDSREIHSVFIFAIGIGKPIIVSNFRRYSVHF